MAVLNATQLAEGRQKVAKELIEVTYVKADINAAFQAVENYFETTARAAINTAINAATSPVVLPAGVKTLIVKHYLKQKFDRGG